MTIIGIRHFSAKAKPESQPIASAVIYSYKALEEALAKLKKKEQL
jgi:hypothetical protein